MSKTEHFSRQAPEVTRVGGITPITEELVIKDYPCKLDKEGTLYIMQHYLSHFAPVFGRERKKIIPFDHVTSLSMADNLKEILLVRKQKNKVSRLEFHNTQDCDEAFALIETMLMNRRRDVPFPSAEHHTRAVALYEFKGEHEHDLSFKVNDVIVVLQKRPDGWWLGERRGVMGYFPANFVRDDEGLPTLHDWEIVWLGGTTRTLKKGETVISEDERSPGLFQILKGECEVRHDDKQVGTLGKEETFGEISYLGRCVAPNSVVAGAKATVREIPVAYLDKLFSNSPALASRVFKYLAVVLEMKVRCACGVHAPRHSFSQTNFCKTRSLSLPLTTATRSSGTGRKREQAVVQKESWRQGEDKQKGGEDDEEGQEEGGNCGGRGKRERRPRQGRER